MGARDPHFTVLERKAPWMCLKEWNIQMPRPTGCLRLIPLMRMAVQVVDPPPLPPRKKRSHALFSLCYCAGHRPDDAYMDGSCVQSWTRGCTRPRFSFVMMSSIGSSPQVEAGVGRVPRPELGCLLEPRRRGDPTTGGLEQPGACTAAAAWEESWRALWGALACDIPG